MVALPQKAGTSLRLNQLTIEVDRVFDCLVFDWEYLNFLNYLIEEKFAKDIVSDSTGSLLS